jgi:ubiquinone/menaquinone biosynthesis C-methylase UbiE
MITGADARFIGTIPEHYDRGLGPMIFVDYAADIAHRTAALHPSRVLETAAGTGIVTRALRDALPADAQLVATDLNPPMLEIARSKFAPGEPVSFQPADALALPFDDASFDAVVCQFGLMFYPDKPKSYREVHRVLSPGGHYLLSTWDAHRYNPFARITQALVDRVFADDPPQFYKVPFSCNQIDPIVDQLREAGFSTIDIAVLPTLKTIPDTGAFARGIIFGNPLIEQIRGRGGDPHAVYDALVEDLEREFGTAPGRMPLQALVFCATKPS